MPLSTITEFFGWALLLNFVFYVLTAVSLVTFRGLVVRLNTKLFAISESDVTAASFRYLATFKLLVLVFFLSPYLALRLMG